MAQLGSDKRPAVGRVKTMERAAEVMALCEKHGWKVIVGIEPNKPEDISDVESLLASHALPVARPNVGRNDPCPCGSGLKFKKCCLRKYE